MKPVILYYTFGGSTKKEADRLSAELHAPLYRIKESHDHGLFGAVIFGCFSAMRRKAVEIQPLSIDWDEFDRIIIGCPIWAGYPAPAFNTIVERLPVGKEVELFLCSAGGDTQKSEQGTKEMIEKKGCTVVSYRDIRTDVAPQKMKE